MIKIRPEYKQELSILQQTLKYISQDEAEKMIEEEANKYRYIDAKRLLDKLVELAIIGSPINSPKQWLKATLIGLMRNQREEVMKIDKVNTISLYRKFEEEKFSGNKVDKYLIEEIENAILGQPHIYEKDLINLNVMIVDYMLQKNERTYDKFIFYLMKSKLVKDKIHINLEVLKDKVERELTEMEELLNVINNKTTPIEELPRNTL